MTAHQLDLFAPKGITLAERIAPVRGWLQCDCGIVFWEWPIERSPHGRIHSHDGAPQLDPWHRFTCWRGIDRMFPSRRLRA